MRTMNANTQTWRPGPAAYVALLALVVFQLGLAMHPAEHTITDIGETCVACSHYNDIGPVSESVALPAAAPPAEALVPAPVVVADNTRRYPVHARAPPFA